MTETRNLSPTDPLDHDHDHGDGVTPADAGQPGGGEGPAVGGPNHPGATPTAPDGDSGKSGRGGAGRVLGIIGLTVGGLLAVWAGVHLVDLAVSDTVRSSESYDAVGRVELVADGEVSVRAADVTGVEVEAVSRGGLATPEYAAQEVGSDQLVLSNECPDWAGLVSWVCSGRLHAVVPEGTEVVVRTSNGDVLASGPLGAAEVRTSNGTVQAEDVGGDLEARSTNGDVEVRSVTGDVDVETSNGSIEVRDVTGAVGVVSSNGGLDVAGVGGGLTARTSNGDVDVSDVGGGLTARTSNGDVDVSDVDGSADARSTNGRVDVAAVAGNVFARTSNGSVVVVGDGEPVVLTIDTSNGDEIIQGPTDPASDRSVEIKSSNGDVAYLAP
jgi:DUF4097 and DUF4098 domain-containing protein YvlB